MQIKVKKLHPTARIPSYASMGAACFDLHSCEIGPIHVSHGNPVVIGTGLAFEIPPHYAMFIFSRSGHGFNFNMRLANCVGVIDSDYRGEVKIKITQDANIYDEYYPDPVILHGDRIAQAVILPVASITFDEVEELTPTQRGDGGFGSTGK